MKRIQVIRRSLLAVLVVGTFAFRFIPHAGEFYACRMYPAISTFLSAIASLVPFSLDEWVVVLSLVLLVVFPFWARHRMFRWKRILGYEAECLLWIYVWFYWGWGNNYFRDGFYQRAEVAPRAYHEAEFKQFLREYTDSLNASYCTETEGEREDLHRHIKQLYRTVPSRFGLAVPYDFQHPKYTCFNILYSKVGVLGYMGPFFAESHVNRELLPVQYPFTYAHELSHLLGISSEAEANYWAYQICTRSHRSFVRYSGYFGILPYVIFNARMLLGESDYQAWINTLRPEVIAQLKAERAYWDERYSQMLGKIQSAVYEFYLKGNRISDGQKNYAEVVGMLLALPAIR